jgi:hypothetical protein
VLDEHQKLIDRLKKELDDRDARYERELAESEKKCNDRIDALERKSDLKDRALAHILYLESVLETNGVRFIPFGPPPGTGEHKPLPAPAPKETPR